MSAAYDYAACVLMLVIARHEAQPAPISDVLAAAGRYSCYVQTGPIFGRAAKRRVRLLDGAVANPCVSSFHAAPHA